MEKMKRIVTHLTGGMLLDGEECGRNVTGRGPGVWTCLEWKQDRRLKRQSRDEYDTAC